MHSAQTLLVCVAILALMTPVWGSQTAVGPPANPFLDPKNDPYNPLRYIASNTLTAIAFGKWRIPEARPWTHYLLTYSSARHAHRAYPDLLHLAIWRKVDARNGRWSV